MPPTRARACSIARMDATLATENLSHIQVRGLCYSASARGPVWLFPSQKTPQSGTSLTLHSSLMARGYHHRRRHHSRRGTRVARLNFRPTRTVVQREHHFRFCIDLGFARQRATFYPNVWNQQVFFMNPVGDVQDPSTNRADMDVLSLDLVAGSAFNEGYWGIHLGYNFYNIPMFTRMVPDTSPDTYSCPLGQMFELFKTYASVFELEFPDAPTSTLGFGPGVAPVGLVDLIAFPDPDLPGMGLTTAPVMDGRLWTDLLTTPPPRFRYHRNITMAPHPNRTLRFSWTPKYILANASNVGAFPEQDTAVCPWLSTGLLTADETAMGTDTTSLAYIFMKCAVTSTNTTTDVRRFFWFFRPRQYIYLKMMLQSNHPGHSYVSDFIRRFGCVRGGVTDTVPND